ncbi:MAG: nucleoside 2-deoxyribosyltransferase [Pseudonocardiaceae bacterium]
MSNIGTNRTPPAIERGARLLVGVGEFGWGSAGKLRLVLDRLPELDPIVIGSELGHELLVRHAAAYRDTPRTTDDAVRLLDDLRADAALVVGEPVLAERLVAAGCPVVFLDSLPFLWTENDPVAINVDTYCAQRCVPTPAWDVLCRAKRLVWVDSVVPSDGVGRPDPMASQAHGGVVINVGGLHSPFSGTTGDSYLRTLLPPVLRAVRDHGLSVDAVCGNIDADQAGWLRTQTGDGVHIGVLSPSEFEAALRSARLLITSPGSTTLLQANQCATPIIILPPQNLSQVVNAEWFGQDRSRAAVTWPDSVLAAEEFKLVRDQSEEVAVNYLYIAVSRAEGDPAVADELYRRAVRVLAERDSLPTRRPHLDRLGSQGAEQVAHEVRRLLRRGRECVLASRSPGLRIYVGGPFQAALDNSLLRINDDYRALYQELLDEFEDCGWQVFNAHRREAWGAQLLDDSRSTRLDFEDVSACDVFVATPGVRPASRGTHIEIGWASALRKKIILLIQDECEYAALVTGLPSVADVTFVPFAFGRPVARAVSRVIEEFAAGPADSSVRARVRP